MRLSPGDKLGHYDIVEQIGAGGMGVVYRARDPRVGRDVAIKISNEHFSSRFEREAQAVAALNHPNVCTLHDVGPNYLVMELVDGEALRGPLPFQAALNYARQIADALDAAHQKNIVHRDLKPANIRVRSDGTVKVLDFGLAKIDDAPTSAADAANSPTMPLEATQAGMILGTAAYMAPEQARGKPVDKRADIWSFGAVFYEMLTGRRAFDGEDVSTIIAAVIHAEPRWDGVPDNVRRLLESCLQKDPRKRLRDIGDVWNLIDDAGTPAAAPSRFRQAGWIAAAALGITAAAALWAPWRTAPATAASTPVTVSVDLGEGVALQPMVAPTFSSVIISPDGTRVVFVGSVAGSDPRLYVQRLDGSALSELAGTKGALHPFFSHDGQWVAFWREFKLVKVRVDGGAVVPVADLDVMTGGTWTDDETIFTGSGYPHTTGTVRTAAGGGAASSVVEMAKGELFHSFPQVLPGRKAMLFAVVAGVPPSVDTTSIEVVSLETGRRKTLVRAATSPRYLSSGHLVYASRTGMFAMPFDAETFETGDAVAILRDAAFDPVTGAAQYDVSRGGTLVYRKRVGSGEAIPTRVQWLERSGRQTPLLVTPGLNVGAPRLSPDGGHLAMAMRDGADQDIFVFDTTRDAPIQLTSGSGKFDNPVWSGDGRHIIFASLGAGMLSKRADGSGQAQPLLPATGFRIPMSVTREGKRLAFLAIDGLPQMWSVLLEEGPAGPKAGEPERFLKTQATDGAMAISPDGHWVAYQSNESGKAEVYVLPFPIASGNNRVPISSGGGGLPRWLPAGGELLYKAGARIMTVSYTTKNGSFVAGKPRAWADVDVSGSTGFDIASNGRLAITLPLTPYEARRPEHTIGFVLNFFDDLRRRVPTGR